MSRILLAMLFFFIAIHLQACGEDESPNNDTVNDGTDPDADREGFPVALCGDYAQDLTLSNINEGIDYLVTCDVEFTDGILTVEPETTIVFENATGLRVLSSAGIHAKGGLPNPGGSAAPKPISFRGKSASKIASWDGIEIHSSEVSNSLQNVRISGAGAFSVSDLWHEGRKTALLLGSYVALDTVTIDVSGGAGIDFESNVILSRAKNIEIGRTKGHVIKAPIAIAATQLSEHAAEFSFFSSETLANGTVGLVGRLLSSRNLNDYTAFVFKDIGLPYYSYSGVEGSGSVDVVFSEGVEMIFAGSVGVQSSRSRLAFLGTSESPVVLRGEEAIAGFWGGVGYYSNSPLNAVQNTVIEDAVNGIEIQGQYSNHIALDIQDSQVSNTSDCGVLINHPLSSLTFTSVGNHYFNNGRGSSSDPDCLGNMHD